MPMLRSSASEIRMSGHPATACSSTNGSLFRATPREPNYGLLDEDAGALRATPDRVIAGEAHPSLGPRAPIAYAALRLDPLQPPA